MVQDSLCVKDLCLRVKLATVQRSVKVSIKLGKTTRSKRQFTEAF